MRKIDAALISELPPRARRILSEREKKKSPKGTTSACAENTKNFSNKEANTWNYLRVRGEYCLPK